MERDYYGTKPGERRAALLKGGKGPIVIGSKEKKKKKKG